VSKNKTIIYIGKYNRFTCQDFADWEIYVELNEFPATYLMYENITALFPKFSDPKFHVDFINIDVESLLEFNNENPYALISTLKTLASTTLSRDFKTGKTKKRDAKIIGVVSYHTIPEVIKQLAPLVDGLCISASGEWTRDMIGRDQLKLISGDLSIPKEIQKKLRCSKKTVKKDEISLTPRQQQVLNLVATRGASNKVIAKSLNISESTVKLHLGCVLKKYGLKSRTQLAIFAKDSV
jgi:DNA-binding NarL/FixJ family response regulator